MKKEKLNLNIIGAAQQLGCSKEGVQFGPDSIRKCGLFEKLQNIDIIINDFGNIYNDLSIESIPNQKLKNFEQIAEFNQRLSDVVFNTLQNDQFPFVLGGDHSIGIGSVSGASEKFGADDLGLIWIDAHTDINTQDTTPTGNIHGMSIASLLSYGNEELMSICGQKPKIKPENIIYVAARDIDEGEAEIIKQNNISVIHMNEIISKGMDYAINHLKELLDDLKVENIYLSVDIDVLDPQIAPGTGVPVPHGINKDQLLTFIDIIAKTGKIKGAELVEVNPLLDSTDFKTSFLAVEIINFMIKSIAKYI